jgi:hypothetical protein
MSNPDSRDTPGKSGLWEILQILAIIGTEVEACHKHSLLAHCQIQNSFLNHQKALTAGFILKVDSFSHLLIHETHFRPRRGIFVRSPFTEREKPVTFKLAKGIIRKTDLYNECLLSIAI